MQDEHQAPSDPESPPASAVPADSPGETQGVEVAPDQAPDANEPGDDLPAELEEHVHDGDVQPDEVDQKDVEE